ncbi:MAG: Trm112 family protein [Burkholderiales bacterium]|jgi:uncharacterized protein YbaR (Trm112 family)|nr:Trm112 family protein [Burkholderiales bacterium]
MPIKPSDEKRADKKLLELLVCPVTRGKLTLDREQNELISVAAKLAYPIKAGVPVMLEDEARKLTDEECLRYKKNEPVL